ncbi:MAG: hypothetical protein EPO32_09390 [Anaerolineae bacterium]|nr:MAG: hypothetical protein EPO32_09390 [Anaerolineae bacterium]
MNGVFPVLDGLGATRDTLHLYAQAVDAFPRAHAEPHDKWWHIGLRLRPNGFTTAEMPLPDGGTFRLFMNFKTHRIELEARNAVVASWDMSARWTGKALGESLMAAVGALGVRGEYSRERFESDAPRAYDKWAAAAWFAAASLASEVFEALRVAVGGETSPVHLWPHHFDLSTEFFGTRTVDVQEHGEVKSYPAQLNLGFSTGDAGHPGPYFYSNPYPFDESLVREPLPEGARWHIGAWKGSLLPYSEVAGRPDGVKLLAGYAEAVYKAAKAGLGLA